VHKLYRVLLKLYPTEYQAVFAPEMTEVFEQASAEFKQRGLLGRIVFVTCECTGLLKGAAREHAAKWAAQDSYITSRCALRDSSEHRDEISQVQRRLGQLIRSMEFAIAHHDFPKARFYSDEERATRALLSRLVNQTTK
jgi:hypothetical protein